MKVQKKCGGGRVGGGVVGRRVGGQGGCENVNEELKFLRKFFFFFFFFFGGGVRSGVGVGEVARFGVGG